MSIFFLMGIVFAVVAIICGVAAIIVAFYAANIWVVLMMVAFILIFGGIGVGMFNLDKKEKKKKQDIIDKGEKVCGTIVEYGDDTTMYVNDVPGLDIFVSCIYEGVEQTFRIRTRQTREDKYPLGATCMLSIYNGQAEVVPDSIR